MVVVVVVLMVVVPMVVVLMVVVFMVLMVLLVKVLVLEVMVGLVVGGLAVMASVDLVLGAIGLLYVCIHVAYSLGMKQVVLIDLMAVASGYVIRAAAGAVAIDVAASPWLYATTGAGALFIVLGRRYAEVRLAGDAAAQQRPVLGLSLIHI